MNIEKLKLAYTSNKTVKAICEEMASRDRNQNETKTNRILGILGSKGLDDLRKNELIAAFRALEEAGCGRYVEGRHSWPSRFVWEAKSLDVATMANGQRPPEPSPPTETETELEMIEHSFALRPGLTIEIELPDDLTRSEADRLAGFLRVLPFEE